MDFCVILCALSLRKDPMGWLGLFCAIWFSPARSVFCGPQVIEVAKLMKAYINQIVKLRRASYFSQASSEASDSYM